MAAIIQRILLYIRQQALKRQPTNIRDLLRAASLVESVEGLEDLPKQGMEALLSEVRKTNTAMLEIKEQLDNMRVRETLIIRDELSHLPSLDGNIRVSNIETELYNFSLATFIRQVLPKYPKPPPRAFYYQDSSTVDALGASTFVSTQLCENQQWKGNRMQDATTTTGYREPQKQEGFWNRQTSNRHASASACQNQPNQSTLF